MRDLRVDGNFLMICTVSGFPLLFILCTLYLSLDCLYLIGAMLDCLLGLVGSGL